jgi:AcrR family transcriptional regulator
MRRLAGRVGIRAPSLYKHFADKAQIEDALVARSRADLERRLGPARLAGDPGPAIVDTAMRFARERPETFSLLAERHQVALSGVGPRERALLLLVEGVVALERSGAASAAAAAAILEQGASFTTFEGPHRGTRAVVSSVRGPD